MAYNADDGGKFKEVAAFNFYSLVDAISATQKVGFTEAQLREWATLMHIDIRQ